MKKYWIQNNKHNRLIFIKDNTVYLGSPKDINDLNLINELEKGITPKNMFNIPYSYIRKIENQEGKNIITIDFGEDSEEKLRIDNENIKKEIFELLKNELSEFGYIQKTPTIYKQAKPQIFAILILTGIFLWTLFLAIEKSKGIDYEIVGKAGINAIVLGLAQFGTFNVIIGYILLISVVFFLLIKRVKNRSQTEYLFRKNY